MRHAWWLVLAACGSSGSSPDASSDAVCEMDCAGVCNGSAMTDRCGVCDTDPTNDCWKGVHGLSSLTPLPDQANLGSGKLAYEVSSVAQQRGLFYGGPAMTMPALGIAQVT
ncbi:MAG TPA: hypothetical protein VFV99_23110, partial [Kofleriaceae bacterium]|nr:hypothetical protein [Kofleriaceae bacterium]